MAKKAPKLSFSGVTSDGVTRAVSGIFRFHSEHGLPLVDILDLLKTINVIIDWPDFIAGAKQDGWKDRTIVSKIVSACTEVYDKEYTAEVEKRLRSYLSSDRHG